MFTDDLVVGHNQEVVEEAPASGGLASGVAGGSLASGVAGGGSHLVIHGGEIFLRSAENGSLSSLALIESHDTPPSSSHDLSSGLGLDDGSGPSSSFSSINPLRDDFTKPFVDYDCDVNLMGVDYDMEDRFSREREPEKEPPPPVMSSRTGARTIPLCDLVRRKDRHRRSVLIQRVIDSHPVTRLK